MARPADTHDRAAISPVQRSVRTVLINRYYKTVKAGATFNLKSANNTTDGGNGLPVIGGATPVALIS